MQLINVMLRLGGDVRNTVPKFGITVAEAQLLRAIHGDDALSDVEPLDAEVDITPRKEVERLAEVYTGRDPDGRPIVLSAFAAGTPSTIDDLGLDETAFAVAERVKPVKSTGKNRSKPAAAANDFG